MTDRAAVASAPAHAPGRTGRYRWVVVALLFSATIVNYVDRQMLGILKPLLSTEFGWSDTAYGDIAFWFSLAYAIGYIGFGRVVDVFGARIGYAVAIGVWTLSHMAHGLAGNATQFAMARFGLGIGESGNFPAGIRAITDWFPQKERALAIGIFNAGGNIGAVITPLMLSALLFYFDWRMAFFITGLLGVVLLVAWWTIYRHPDECTRLGAAERAWIEQDPVETAPPMSWAMVATRRPTLAFSAAKLLTDPVWFFYLFWLPGYLTARYDLTIAEFALPLAIIYLISDFGSVAAGWLSSRLIAAGRSVNFARKATMLLCSFLVLPLVWVQSVDSLWLAVLIIGLATAAHQGFSTNLLSIPSDTMPRRAVGSVIGIGGTAGALGVMAMNLSTGRVLDATGGNYSLIFAACAATYIVALMAIHLLSPRLQNHF